MSIKNKGLGFFFGNNKKLINNLTIVGLLFLSSFLFFDTIFFDKYPVTSADPAIKYWSAVYNSQNIAKGIFSLWNSSAGVLGKVYFLIVFCKVLLARSHLFYLFLKIVLLVFRFIFGFKFLFLYY